MHKNANSKIFHKKTNRKSLPTKHLPGFSNRQSFFWLQTNQILDRTSNITNFFRITLDRYQLLFRIKTTKPCDYWNFGLSKRACPWFKKPAKDLHFYAVRGKRWFFWLEVIWCCWIIFCRFLIWRGGMF
jgi:hypothetical protein